MSRVSEQSLPYMGASPCLSNATLHHCHHCLPQQWQCCSPSPHGCHLLNIDINLAFLSVSSKYTCLFVCSIVAYRHFDSLFLTNMFCMFENGQRPWFSGTQLGKADSLFWEPFVRRKRRKYGNFRVNLG